jgi:hypothetical protein
VSDASSGFSEVTAVLKTASGARCKPNGKCMPIKENLCRYMEIRNIRSGGMHSIRLSAVHLNKQIVCPTTGAKN